MAIQDIVFGKHVLESLSVGMYSDPLTIYREYIQNATDSLDNAISSGLVKADAATIYIKVDQAKRLISIRDNGVGVKANQAYSILLDVANSQKNYQETRGFRGIGRLGGLGCSKKLIFTTSSFGEATKSVVTWDCDNLLRMLNRENKEAKTALEVMQKVTNFEQCHEEISEHYFEVRLENVYPEYEELLCLDKVAYYLSTVAPVPFDAQKFSLAPRIAQKLSELGKYPEEYRIFLNDSVKPIYKMYKSQVKTGHQQRTKKTDYIKDIKFFYEYKDDNLIYFGWYGITNFYGSISDRYMQGIRVRKGNILLGNESTFSRFFKSEGEKANSCFIGEIYIYDPELIPNAKRDDFERNQAYSFLDNSLSRKAEELNRLHRRLMSEYHSAVKSIEELVDQTNKIEQEISQGGITSDIRKDRLLGQQEQIDKRLQQKRKELERIKEKTDLEEQYKQQAEDVISRAESTQKKMIQLENSIINAEYATKFDLPTSYSREERKLYQRIISIIDEFFAEDKTMAEQLRVRICKDLGRKKKC